MNEPRALVAVGLVVFAAWRLIRWDSYARADREWLGRRFGPSDDSDLDAQVYGMLVAAGAALLALLVLIL